jgi:hypothetical protein
MCNRPVRCWKACCRFGFILTIAEKTMARCEFFREYIVSEDLLLTRYLSCSAR